MVDGALQIRYPGNQPGTVVSIAVGEPRSSPPPWKDFSRFHTVSFELRGSRGRENVLVGIKDGADADDHVYNQVLLRDISTQFQTYTIPLSDFASQQLPIADRLKRLHRVLELFFDGAQAQTVYVKNVRYVASN